ncbi:hypothetical protein [Aquimarina algicola]|uniref:Uncharacterized protein n=1 Tax=Aquimarina algicola TaxID=2589995 RepID=A0A504IVK5_9FLAO|nr:hypothetical protein [Aquimarina algicola]TPN82386.1 hypothetical protein FHK87_23485 [Aquimarina algicola]
MITYFRRYPILSSGLATILAVIVCIALYFAYLIIKVPVKRFFTTLHHVYWDERSIEIDDFKGFPDYASNANYNYFVGVYVDDHEHLERVYAKAFFDQKEAWIKDKKKFNKRFYLRVIQLKFNIMELYARELNQNMYIMKCNHTISLDAIAKIMKYHEEQFKNIDMQIDQDLKGFNTSKLDQWEKQIQQELVDNPPIDHKICMNHQ